MSSPPDPNEPMTAPPYAPGELFADASVQREFRARLGSALQPLFAEVVSDRTRVLQQHLLILASILLLLSFSVIDVAPEAQWSGLTIRSAGAVALAIMLAVTAYLEVVVALRSAVEWSAWRIAAGAAEDERDEALRFARQTPVQIMREQFSLHADVTSDRHREDGFHTAHTSQEHSTRASTLFSAHSNDIAKAKWVLSRIANQPFLHIARATIEVIFPVVFGATAIVLAIRAL